MTVTNKKWFREVFPKRSLMLRRNIYGNSDNTKGKEFLYLEEEIKDEVLWSPFMVNVTPVVLLPIFCFFSFIAGNPLLAIDSLKWFVMRNGGLSWLRVDKALYHANIAIAFAIGINLFAFIPTSSIVQSVNVKACAATGYICLAVAWLLLAFQCQYRYYVIAFCCMGLGNALVYVTLQAIGNLFAPERLELEILAILSIADAMGVLIPKLLVFLSRLFPEWTSFILLGWGLSLFVTATLCVFLLPRSMPDPRCRPILCATTNDYLRSFYLRHAKSPTATSALFLSTLDWRARQRIVAHVAEQRHKRKNRWALWGRSRIQQFYSTRKSFDAYPPGADPFFYVEHSSKSDTGVDEQRRASALDVLFGETMRKSSWSFTDTESDHTTPTDTPVGSQTDDIAFSSKVDGDTSKVKFQEAGKHGVKVCNREFTSTMKRGYSLKKPDSVFSAKRRRRRLISTSSHSKSKSGKALSLRRQFSTASYSPGTDSDVRSEAFLAEQTFRRNSNGQLSTVAQCATGLERDVQSFSEENYTLLQKLVTWLFLYSRKSALTAQASYAMTFRVGENQDDTTSAPSDTEYEDDKMFLTRKRIIEPHKRRAVGYATRFGEPKVKKQPETQLPILSQDAPENMIDSTFIHPQLLQEALRGNGGAATDDVLKAGVSAFESEKPEHLLFGLSQVATIIAALSWMQFVELERLFMMRDFFRLISRSSRVAEFYQYMFDLTFASIPQGTLFIILVGFLNHIYVDWRPLVAVLTMVNVLIFLSFCAQLTQIVWLQLLTFVCIYIWHPLVRGFAPTIFLYLYGKNCSEKLNALTLACRGLSSFAWIVWHAYSTVKQETALSRIRPLLITTVIMFFPIILLYILEPRTSKEITHLMCPKSARLSELHLSEGWQLKQVALQKNSSSVAYSATRRYRPSVRLATLLLPMFPPRFLAELRCLNDPYSISSGHCDCFGRLWVPNNTRD